MEEHTIWNFAMHTVTDCSTALVSCYLLKSVSQSVSQSVNQSINQPKHTYIAPCAASKSEAPNGGD